MLIYKLLRYPQDLGTRLRIAHIPIYISKDNICSMPPCIITMGQHPRCLSHYQGLYNSSNCLCYYCGKPANHPHQIYSVCGIQYRRDAQAPGSIEVYVGYVSAKFPDCSTSQSWVYNTFFDLLHFFGLYTEFYMTEKSEKNTDFQPRYHYHCFNC